jgi:acyl carrier protein|uniref:acyl carrier protein n=1 Tax=Paralia sulcata TaxID=216927 RepID=UPI0022F30E38|nr:acyl carrier protein [Paralia sulcata]YP_010595128.1 acyl carrier protein [Paralia sulcata]WAJ57804.1 acyl carrier protein [Paralia sulcata]WAJ57863.1 acyl carrier protein [Paralia sulcata]
MSNTLEQIQKIVCEQLGVDAGQVKPEASFTKELGADSLDVVELVMAFEEEFEIEIDDESAGEIQTVQDALDYIEKAQE